MDIELETLSPRAISPLNGIVDFQETRADVAVDARKRIPTEKGRQFEIQRLKESRKTALANLTKQINVILPLLAHFENEKQVRIEVVQLDQLFVKMQEVHDMYLSALDDESEIELARQWYDARDMDVLRSKQRINDYLHDAKKLRSGLHDTNSVKSKSSRHSRGSHSSSSSTKLRLIEAKARAAALEVEARFLKEKQALRMASEELELRQKIAEAKAEERTYEEFDEEQNIDGMNNYLEGVKAKLTATPFLSEAKPNDHTTLRVPFGRTVATTPPVTAPTFVTTAGVNPAARPFVSRNPLIKEEYGTPIDTKLSHIKGEECVHKFESDRSGGESAKPDQSYLDIHRKQTELTQMIATQQARSLLPSHEPPTFSGDVMSYPAFIAAFETLIESKVDNSSELLYFLDQYTSGKAKELIKGCLQMKSEDSYKEARRLLKKHFGDPYKIVSAYIAKLSNWPAVRPNDGTGLQEFSTAL